MVTEAWTQLRPHAEQSRYYRSRIRFKVVCAGRGSGKTELARRKIVRWLAVRKPHPDALYFYALPTRDQAKRVAWPYLKALIPREWLQGSPSESELVIKTKFGSELHVVGMDKPQRIEGNQWDGGIIDECSDQKPGAFDRSVLPALSHKNGWCDRIGVPKRFGPGAVEFRQVFEQGLREEDPDLRSFSWSSSSVLTEAELRFAKANLDDKDFDEQYNANWQTAGGLVFHGFCPVESVRECYYNPALPIIVGSDFNVSPMSWVLGHAYPDRFEVFDEISLNNTHTQATLDYLHAQYGEHPSGFLFYGDASGRARKTSATTSDYLLIKNDKRFKSRVHYPKANPLVANRFASTNSLLRNAVGERRCFIDPGCSELIRDLQQRGVSSSSDVGHMTDALGYIIHYRWPIRLHYESHGEIRSSLSP